jgi:hypothetical protein
MFTPHGVNQLARPCHVAPFARRRGLFWSSGRLRSRYRTSKIPPLALVFGRLPFARALSTYRPRYRLQVNARYHAPCVIFAPFN